MHTDMSVIERTVSKLLCGVAALGLKVRGNGCTYHGVSLNVAMDLAQTVLGWVGSNAPLVAWIVWGVTRRQYLNRSIVAFFTLVVVLPAHHALATRTKPAGHMQVLGPAHPLVGRAVVELVRDRPGVVVIVVAPPQPQRLASCGFRKRKPWNISVCS